MTRLPSRRVGPRSSVALAVAAALSAAAHAAPAPALAPSPAPGPMIAMTTLQEVVVTGKALQLKSLKQRSIYESAYGDKALDRQQLKSAGVVGGAAQALSFAPGISVSGYGQTGGTKASISVNGLKQGWGGFSGGTIDDGSIAVSFDGIPMVNAATGLWETPEVPQTGILQGARVTYGPGDPEYRWYNNIGGSVNFVPLQPTAKAGGSVALTYGSFATENAVVILQTGKIDGWETVFAGGGGRSDSFRTSPDGFNWPTQNFAGFFKTRKEFRNGDVSFGAYIGDGHGWRPTPIPLTPNALISANGQDANGNPLPGPLFSQQTTGFYSAINSSVWKKNDYNRTWLVYARQNIQLDKHVTLHNQLWYRQGNRLHVHYNNYVAGAGNLYEHNNPFSHMYGDKIWADVYLPYNKLGIGGFFVNTVYNSRNQFYSPNACVTLNSPVTYTAYGQNPTTLATGSTICGSAAVPNANYRSDYWHVTNLDAFFQDAITPIASLTITPGIRAVNFQTDYNPNGATEYPEAAALDAYCNTVGGSCAFSGHDQGKLGSVRTNYDKVEPSVSARWQPLHWLAIYGNWATAYRLRQVGGGGGLYQSTPAVGDILERSVEYQAGTKLFWPEIGAFSKVLINLNYYHIHFSNQFIGVSSGNGNFLGLGTGDSMYHGVNLSAEANLRALKMFANLNEEKANFNQYDFQGTNYNGMAVPYVPNTTFNIGAYYHLRAWHGIVLKPRAWYQYVGTQHMFDNYLGAPSAQKMPSYGVLNLALAATVPGSWYGDAVKKVQFKVEVMNVTDKRYNIFQELSSGGLYNTGSYVEYPMGLPGAPRAVYGTIAVKF